MRTLEKVSKTVKTERRAKEIINHYINENNLENGIYYTKVDVLCNCGDAYAVRWFDGTNNITVPVCSECGDDSLSENDVLYLNTL
jgi:methyltransferase-like protein